MPNRIAHARALLSAIDVLVQAANGKPGIYLEVSSRPGEPFVTDSLNKSELTLLRVTDPSTLATGTRSATVFASEQGLENLRKKVADFETKNRNAGRGRPYNADLVQSISAIVEAGLRALWRSPSDQFPQSSGTALWEVWLNKDDADDFIQSADEFEVAVGTERLEFPEDLVVIVNATPNALAAAVRNHPSVRALAASSVTADFFDSMPVDEQDDWADDLGRLTTFSSSNNNYITLLDTGVSRGNPLIRPALRRSDRHAANPGWGVDDVNGHGTQMAGLCLYGDLTSALQLNQPFDISHRLEAVKVIPDAGYNLPHMLGAVTRAGVNAVEAAAADRVRTFALPTTTEDDTPHDGAPTSWSSELDQLSAGVSGEIKLRRLFVVSAGNSDQSKFGNQDYLPVCDHPDNEIEAPAQAWNVVSVGAHTEKNVLQSGTPGTALASFGDLSPSSRTASWDRHWPIKPDIVLEGGNWLVDRWPPPLRHEDLSLLTTDRDPARTFTTACDTSAATALAARMVAQLRAEYPALWPETVRALLVGSASWTSQMKSHLPIGAQRGDYATLFKRYGYGVPDIERARNSASNALTLIVEDTITPYRRSATANADHVHNEMKLFSLPWPTRALRGLGNATVRLRVALSTFIEPNPSEPARGSKYTYASHNLRFKLNRANENEQQFVSRINAAADASDTPIVDEEDGWLFGRNRRDVGSIHIDELTCRASDLARRGILAVHPISGWWKTNRAVDPTSRAARFALVVEIDASHEDVDLYAEVQTQIANRNLVVV